MTKEQRRGLKSAIGAVNTVKWDTSVDYNTKKALQAIVGRLKAILAEPPTAASGGASTSPSAAHKPTAVKRRPLVNENKQF
jgi:hypothetical protein